MKHAFRWQEHTPVSYTHLDVYKRQDEYLADNIFFVPEKARGSAVAVAAHTEEIGKVIDAAMLAIETENRSLKNVLPKNLSLIHI